MNSVIEVLYLRRPRLEYISPPVCEFDFSSSGGPVIVLDALGRLLSPSGFVLGGRGRFILSWNNYPGALCYTVYKANDSNNPFGEYHIVAECIENPSINLEPEGPGCYRVSAITENGETELSDPICDVGGCPFITSGANPPVVVIDSGDTINLSAEVGNAGVAEFYRWYRDGILISDTTGTTQEALSIPNAQQSDSGQYTLVVGNGGCSDESDPSSVTVNAGPPCTESIEIVGFLSALDIGSEGLIIGTSASARPFYYSNGISKDIRSTVDSSPITASQTLTTVTASAPIFSASDVGKFIEFSTSETAEITAFISNLQVTVSPSQSVASTTFLIHGVTLGGPTGQGVLVGGNRYLSGLEIPFSDPGNDHIFWLDLNTNEIRDLGSLVDFGFGAMSSDGYLAINDFTGGPSQAKIYNPNDQSLTSVGNFGGSATVAFQGALNTSHHAAVIATVAGTDHAARWNGVTLIDIHPAAAGPEPSQALAINESGIIMGTYTEDVTVVQKTFVNSGGLSISIGDFGGAVAGFAIGSSGMIVGDADSGGDTRPYFWTQADGINLIPMLGGTTSGSAVDVNADDWVVGSMDGNAFIYRNGVTEELFTLIPGGTLWSALITADLISDSGLITGFGIYNGNLERYALQLCS